ncbi:protein of unknown function [Hyphomicrobium sp. 1Nfss2.1]
MHNNSRRFLQRNMFSLTFAGLTGPKSRSRMVAVGQDHRRIVGPGASRRKEAPKRCSL